MNFDFTPRDQALWRAVEPLVEAKNPIALDGAVAARGALGPLLADLSATGYLDLALTDTEDGTVNLTAAMERVARHCPDLFLMLEMSTRVFGRLLQRWGNTQVKAAMLDPVRKGRAVGAVALCEGAQNTGATDLKTAGVAEGDRVRVSGQKSHVLNAAGADCFAVFGRLEARTAVFIIPRNTPGVTVGPAAGTLAGGGAWLGPITLNDCMVNTHQVLVPETEAPLMEIVRMWENQVVCAAALGEMGGAFDLARAFANEHHNGGKPVIAHQAVAFKLAEMYTLRQTAQLLAYHAGWLSGSTERDALTLMYCAKVFCTEAAERIASEALQVVGVHGCTPDGPLARALGRSKFGSLYGTSSEIARNTIGDAMMKYVD
jgi:acyl-CoA dehydrogenase